MEEPIERKEMTIEELRTLVETVINLLPSEFANLKEKLTHDDLKVINKSLNEVITKLNTARYFS